jgi:hypothetical protein
MATDRGKCVTCGFLANRVRPSGVAGEDFREISNDQRDTCEIITFASGRTETTFFELTCFVAEVDLEKEINLSLSPGEETTIQAIYDVLHNERDCPAWFPYQPSFGPKWHLEQKQMRDLEDRREHFERQTFVYTSLIALAGVVVTAIGIIVAVAVALYLSDTDVNINFPSPSPQASQSVEPTL